MSMGMFLSHMLRQKPSRKCNRCGLRYAIDSETCPHCSELIDEEVTRLKRRLMREQTRNGQLGRVMLIVTAVLTVVMIAAVLFVRP